MEYAENFVEEYDYIHEKLTSLMEDTHDRDLSKELFDLISVLEEDYEGIRNDLESQIEESQEEEYNAEMAYYDRCRFNDL